MFPFVLLAPFRRTVRRVRTSVPTAGHRRGGRPPRIDPLEDRWLLSTIIDLGDFHVTPAAINASGQVVGRLTVGADTHAFLYSGGTLSDLGTVAGFADSYAKAINDNGKVVGYLDNGPGSVEHAMLYNIQNGIMSDRGTAPGFTSGQATGLNDVGQATGSAYTTGGSDEHAFLYAGGTFTDVTGAAGSQANALNASGQVVGSNGANGHAYLDTAGQLTDLGTLGGYTSNATAINASGQVVGSSPPSIQLVRPYPFRWTPDVPNGTTGHLIGLGLLPDGANIGYANGINSAGQVVGSDYSFGTPLDAFLYDNGTLMNLNDFLPSGSGWHLTQAQAINDAGQVVGFGTLNGQAHGYLLDLNAAPAAHGPGPTLSTGEPALAVPTASAAQNSRRLLDLPLASPSELTCEQLAPPNLAAAPAGTGVTQAVDSLGSASPRTAAAPDPHSPWSSDDLGLLALNLLGGP